MRKITVEVEDELLKNVKLLAVERNLSVTAIIRGLLESWVRRQKESV